MDMSSANQCHCSRELRPTKAFDTNALQPGHDFVGRLTCLLARARSAVRPSRPCRSAPVGSILRDADLLRAFFECSGLTAQMREDFAGEVK